MYKILEGNSSRRDWCFQRSKQERRQLRIEGRRSMSGLVEILHSTIFLWSEYIVINLLVFKLIKPHLWLEATILMGLIQHFHLSSSPVVKLYKNSEDGSRAWENNNRTKPSSLLWWVYNFFSKLINILTGKGYYHYDDYSDFLFEYEFLYLTKQLYNTTVLHCYRRRMKTQKTETARSNHLRSRTSLKVM